MTETQRSILRRKVAAAELRANAENDRASKAGDIVATEFNGYFGATFKPGPLRVRALDRARLADLPMRGAWFLFRRGDLDIIVGFDAAMLAASVNAALLRPIDEAPKGEPTIVDRSIAAALAARLAAAFAAMIAGPSDVETVKLQAAGAPGDLVPGKQSLAFDAFEATEFRLAPGVSTNMLIAVAGDGVSRAPGKTSAPAWYGELSRIAATTEVSVSASLGVIETTIGDVVNLSPGRLLPFAAARIDHIRLAARGAPASIFTGSLGARDGRRAVRIARRGG